MTDGFHPAASGSLFGARAGGRVTAVLGPTNTGKTYLAIERMMGHASGMIGLPAAAAGARELRPRRRDQGAPIRSRWSPARRRSCRPIRPISCAPSKSMPLEREVAFLAVDEVQLAADPERGHVFTDRLLNARGYGETMLLGAETIAPFIRRAGAGLRVRGAPALLDADLCRRPRRSRACPRAPPWSPSRPPQVYAIAELLRRQRGGAAVVMGALSPAHPQRPGRHVPGGRGRLHGGDRRHRHGPQHGRRPRRFRRARQVRRPPAAGRCTAAELGQIAGRAGRHMADGTFGTTAEAGELAPDLVAAIEDHRFEPVRRSTGATARSTSTRSTR